MSDWILVPCLVALRSEFNAVSPGRRKGADGSIGDRNHNESSDHTPDEDSDVLRGRDADDRNEVHALDIDSAGPWPGGSSWFDAAIKGIVGRHRRGLDDRLQYVIWNRQIANRDVDNWRWRTYTGTADPHTNHAHFSARYSTATELNTSPWGIARKGLTDMDLDDLLWDKGKEPASWTSRYGTAEPTVRNALAFSAYDSTDAEKLLNAGNGGLVLDDAFADKVAAALIRQLSGGAR